jgi:hypothetical protein
MRRVVDRLCRIGLGQVGKGDFATDAGLLLAPIGERSLAGDGLLRREKQGKKYGGSNENDGR